MRDYYDCHDWDIDGYPGEFVYGDYVYVDDYYMDERWLPIYTFPGYWVSNKARVWSSATNRFLRLFPADNWGHWGVMLCRDGKSYHKYIHKLMAEAFIPNPRRYPVVRHLDDIPDNNELENLAWGTWKDNTQDAIRNGHFRFSTLEDREKAWAACRVPVVVTDIRTGERKIYRGVNEAARSIDISRSSVYRILSGEKDSINGYHVEYLNEEECLDDY